MKHTPLKKSAVTLAVISGLFAQAVVAEEIIIDKPNTTFTGQAWTDKVTIQKDALGKDSVVTLSGITANNSVPIGAEHLDGGTLNIQNSTLRGGIEISGEGSVNISDTKYIRDIGAGGNANVSLSNVEASSNAYDSSITAKEQASVTGNNIKTAFASAGGNSQMTLNNSFMKTTREGRGTISAIGAGSLTLNNSRIEVKLGGNDGTITLNNSRWTGAWDREGKGTVALNAGTVWNVTGESAKPDDSLGTLAVSDSSLILAAANVRAKTLSGSNALIHSTFDEAKGVFRTLTADKAEGDFRVALASTGKNISAAEQAALAAPVVVVKDGDSTATFSGSSDLGTWAYDAVARTAEAGGTEVVLVKS
ncbi:TPA: hypothetical protein ACOEME_004769, partial [Enterobacter cloacae subsp. dissolvens]